MTKMGSRTTLSLLNKALCEFDEGPGDGPPDPSLAPSRPNGKDNAGDNYIGSAVSTREAFFA